MASSTARSTVGAGRPSAAARSSPKTNGVRATWGPYLRLARLPGSDPGPSRAVNPATVAASSGMHPCRPR